VMPQANGNDPAGPCVPRLTPIWMVFTSSGVQTNQPSQEPPVSRIPAQSCVEVGVVPAVFVRKGEPRLFMGKLVAAISFCIRDASSIDHK